MRRKSALLLAFAIFACLSVCAQNISVHAVDGKSGKPLAGVRLLVFTFNGPSFREGERSESFDLHTDANGVATIQPDQVKGDHLQIWVDFMTRCVTDINSAPAISVNRVLTSGITDTNSCSTKITATPVRGTLTIYAREATLMEKMAW